MTSESPTALPLRERKKLRTRQTLIAAALELFGAHGFDGVTLDGLCDAAEVSKRTFFRYFDSKEDVAMAPAQDLWAVFLEVLRTCPADGRPLLALFEDCLAEAVERMPADGWAERVLASRRLAARTPSMDAHGLAFCARTTRTALGVVEHRFVLPGAAPSPAVAQPPPVIRGKVGAYVSLEIVNANNGSAQVHVELPDGISSAALPVGRFPSEETYCGGWDRTVRVLVCGGGDRTILRVRIDREVKGARGRIWATGDPMPGTVRTGPLTVDVTGVLAKPEHDPPAWSQPKPGSPDDLRLRAAERSQRLPIFGAVGAAALAVLILGARLAGRRRHSGTAGAGDT
ncbi:TetR/AcrR family transcriptional regulator [Streptomyces sp. WAC07061]|uniref:TetR/AcrR family transcriptional regulator n=1 Tax=Streptomyces sp. WAC07061 TaxID=2487410 RepID=UPI000F78CFB3|nr:TetR/AcrR family transcriptional regulator [Streptomyces sp. WAC07061]RSS50669.1 TetR/AcrR family transcriptional regulator [Streptomyces sp. WAC07061]